MVSNISSSFIGFTVLIVVRVDVIASESITSFDVRRINLCDSLNVIYRDIFSFPLHLTPYYVLLRKRFDVIVMRLVFIARMQSCQ